MSTPSYPHEPAEFVKAKIPSMKTHHVSDQRLAAWKYVGYPGLSAFMASSNDCLTVRKFGALNMRVLLKRQDDIVQKERKLKEMDDFTMDLPGDQGGCGSFRLDAGTPREQLLEEIAVLLKDYSTELTPLIDRLQVLIIIITDERLLNFLQIRDRPTVSPEQTQNLQNWLDNYPNAIENSERDFVFNEHDLLSVRPARRTYFGQWMVSMGMANISAFRTISVDASTKYYDRNTWKRIGGFGMLLGMLVMMFGPLWALPYVSKSEVRLAIVTAFTVAYSFFVTIGTTMKASHRTITVAWYLLHLQVHHHRKHPDPKNFISYFALILLILNFVRSQPDDCSGAGIPAITTTGIVAMTATLTSTVTQQPASTLKTTITQPTTSATASATNPALHVQGINVGAISGIFVGVVIVVIIVCTVLWWLGRRRRHDRSIRQWGRGGVEANGEVALCELEDTEFLIHRNSTSH